MSHIRTAGLNDLTSTSAGMNEVRVACLLFPELPTQVKQSVQAQRLRPQSPSFCFAKRMKIFLILFELSVVP